MEIENSKVYFGSDLKLKISVDFGEKSSDLIDFDVVFVNDERRLVLNQSQLVKVDETTYLACIKSPKTSMGKVTAFVKADFRDEDFADGVHTIVRPLNIDVRIV